MQPIGNEENLAQVREAMAKAQSEAVRLGGELKEGVSIDYASTSGKHYVGTVVFKRPTMKDYMTMGARKSEYLRQAGVVNVNLVDNTIKEMAQIMAVLSTLLVKRPEWLMNLEDVEDADMLFHVYDKYEEWEDSFRKPVSGESSGDSSASK